MNTWTPDKIFLATFVAAALSGLGELLISDRPMTVRSVMAAIVFYGCAGTGLGMICYEYLGGKGRPALVVGSGLLVGIRAIHLDQITEIVRRVLGTKEAK